jgi:hypothetical protein
MLAMRCRPIYTFFFPSIIYIYLATIMAGITPIQPGHEDDVPQVLEKDTPENGASTNGDSKTAKPRARLGPIETVQLPGSDSEPEDGDDLAEGDAEDADEDLLRDFPDDAEVSLLSPFAVAGRADGIGYPPSTFPT